MARAKTKIEECVFCKHNETHIFWEATIGAMEIKVFKNHEDWQEHETRFEANVTNEIKNMDNVGRRELSWKRKKLK